VYPWSVVLHMCEPTCDYCRLLVRALGPHMYCWPPLPLIYIEEGESPFIHHHHTHFTFLSCVRDVTKRSALVSLSLSYILC
jgi:hypothetical protein